ncbi:hypothetical protein D3C85_714630 [compost metagenome]
MIPSFEQRHCAGHRLTPMGGSGGGGNNSAQMYTAMAQMQSSKEQLDWAKEIYAKEAPDRDAASRIATESADASLEQQRLQNQIQAQAWNDYNTQYRPLEAQVVADAKGYDTPEKRAEARAKAVADVETNLASQRAASTREAERAGVNPGSAKAAAMSQSMDLGAAKLKAGASGAADQAVETIGYARRMDAANLGRNIASSQGTSAALGLQAGQAANSASAANLAAGQSGLSNVNAAYAGMQGAYGSLGSAYGAAAGRDAAAAQSKNANVAAGVGAVATVAAVVI